MNPLQYPFDGTYILQKKRALRKQLLATPGLANKKIALLSGSTIGDIQKILELFLLDKGICPEFYQGGYGLYYENIVFDDGTLAAFAPDAIYIHISNRNIRYWPTPADTADTAATLLENEWAHFSQLLQAAQNFGCPVVVNNFELPAWRNFGSLDAADTRGKVWYVRELNRRMAAFVQQNPAVYLHDLEYLASTHGLDAWCDAPSWYAYKYCCAPQFIPALCHSLAGVMGSLFGRTKKAVITDLDNTLWGGVIGEVGAEGIELGDETPAGMAYAEVQRYLKMLAQRGILLSVASKNEKAIAETGFARPDSPLKTDDFLLFEANWNPKSESLNKIAQELNILPDSFVFIDDNPAEREQVTQQIPAVTAPEVTQPENTIALLDRAGYFEVTALSQDDVQRGEMYRKNVERHKMQQSFGNYEDYLKSLTMQAQITSFKAEQLERITQLINKTNQFNLTTRRYTLAETTHCMQQPTYITLAGRLTDKFGDNGLVSVIIGAQSGTVLDIDLWIMSCRVFKRHLEYAMFDALVAQAAQMGIKTLRGRWLPTAKNLLVKDFYATIGFTLEQESETERVFSYTIPEHYIPLNTVITVEG